MTGRSAAANLWENKDNKGDDMNRTAMWIVGIIVVVVVILCITKYNGLARLDEGLQKQWTPLISVLQPRYNAIPKLVNEIILYNGREDDETKALAKAQKEFAAANDMEGQVKAADKV